MHASHFVRCSGRHYGLRCAGGQLRSGRVVASRAERSKPVLAELRARFPRLGRNENGNGNGNGCSTGNGCGSGWCLRCAERPKNPQVTGPPCR